MLRTSSVTEFGITDLMQMMRLNEALYQLIQANGLQLL